MKPRLWPVLLAAGIGLVILCALGTWQVQRLAWKEGLIARLDSKLAAPPVALEQALAARSAGEDVDYTPVTVSGSFANHPAIRLLTSVGGAPGWSLVSGFETAAGPVVLVDRGGLPDGAAMPATPAGVLALTGILRVHASKAGIFDGANDAAGNMWTWWDARSMYGAVGGVAVANDLVLHLVPGSPGSEGLVVAAPKAELRNNHLGYAITWFGLALALVAVTGVFLRGRGKPT
jgi:surfeit locus 1 family protein